MTVIVCSLIKTSQFGNLALPMGKFSFKVVIQFGGERSFSSLKRVKNDLQSTVSQKYLNSFSIL